MTTAPDGAATKYAREQPGPQDTAAQAFRAIRTTNLKAVLMTPGFGQATKRLLRWKAYVQVIVLVSAATLIGLLIQAYISPVNLVMLYLLAVVMVATRSGYGPAVVTAMLSVLVFNFCFVPPQWTLRVADAQYLLTFAGLFMVGVVIANLTTQVLEQAEAAREREAQTAALYALSKDLTITTELDAALDATLHHAQRTFHAEASIYLQQGAQLRLVSATADALNSASNAKLAEQAWRSGKEVEGAQEADRLLALPLKTAQGTLGTLLLRTPPAFAVDTYQYMLSAFSHQVALALESIQLAENARQAEFLRERDKLHTALLNSISHDLRTPLVSITGALSSLRDDALLYDERSRRDLVEGAWQEARRLNRLVGNLLEMTRLEAGMVQLNREFFDIAEVIGVARAQLKERLGDRSLEITIPDNLPLVWVDITLMTLVVVNLIDNALKYSEPPLPIEIRAYEGVEQQLVLEIADRGPGIPEADLPHIFEKFYRSRSSQRAGGTGLGLSICQGIVEVHGGTIQAANRSEGGAVFRITLPTGEGAGELQERNGNG